MSNNIYLKKGLDIPISGVAAQTTKKVIVPDVVAVKPTDFRGLVPKLLVREGDKVLAGTPVLADKMSQKILFASPVSGTVAEVVRGEKRKLLEVRIKADAEQEHVDFGVRKPSDMTADQIKEALLESGLWPAIVQRPYGIIADPQAKPKAIFVSAFSTAPLAADPEFTLREEFANIQTAINALGKLTDGGVHFSMRQITQAPRSTRLRTSSSTLSAAAILPAMSEYRSATSALYAKVRPYGQCPCSCSRQSDVSSTQENTTSGEK